MRWNPDEFRHQKEEILGVLKDKDLSFEVPFISSITFVPLIVIWTFVAEEWHEWKDYANSEIKRLKIFYNITQEVNMFNRYDKLNFDVNCDDYWDIKSKKWQYQLEVKW